MLLLGIETSCDETAAAIVRRTGEARGEILADVILSQVDQHAVFGGVVPEIAARAHVASLDRVVAHALREAKLGFADLDGVAATAGPGLIGGVIVGLTTAKAIAYAAEKPFMAVNHLEGHALTPRLTDGLLFPYLLLLVSGGHTQFVAVRGLGTYERWGTTIDDALGEAFDKTAKLLGLGFPGGPAVERAASSGNPARFRLPKPMLSPSSLDFSFSGLKTAVRLVAAAQAPLSPRDVADIAAAFQATVAEILAAKARLALRRFKSETDMTAPVLVAAGGVAANAAIRTALAGAAAEAGGRLVAPPLRLCGDNGVMIAWAGAERLAAGLVDGFDAPARARWPLDEAAEPKLGGGRLGARA